MKQIVIQKLAKVTITDLRVENKTISGVIRTYLIKKQNGQKIEKVLIEIMNHKDIKIEQFSNSLKLTYKWKSASIDKITNFWLLHLS